MQEARACRLASHHNRFVSGTTTMGVLFGGKVVGILPKHAGSVVTFLA